MRDVKQYDSNRKTFRSWLLDAELRMDPSWDVHTRIKYLRAKLDLTGLVRLEQVLQYLEDHGISRSWEALKERLLLVFPGAMDKHIAVCRMMDVRQEEGEPFLTWVNRVTRAYIEMMGQMPPRGELDNLVFNGLTYQYRVQWGHFSPDDLLDVGPLPEMGRGEMADIGIEESRRGSNPRAICKSSG